MVSLYHSHKRGGAFVAAVERSSPGDIVADLIRRNIPLGEVVESAFGLGIGPHDILTTLESLGYWAHLVHIPERERASPHEVILHISKEPINRQLIQEIRKIADELDSKLTAGKITEKEYERQYWHHPFTQVAEEAPHIIVHAERRR